jgi:hypothetical protein
VSKIIFVLSLVFSNICFADKSAVSDEFEATVAAAYAKAFNKVSTEGALFKNLTAKDARDKRTLELSNERFGKLKPQATANGKVITIKSGQDSVSIDFISHLESKYNINGYDFKLNRRSGFYQTLSFIERILNTKKTSYLSLILTEAHAERTGTGVAHWIVSLLTNDSIANEARANVKELTGYRTFSESLYFSTFGSDDIIVKNISCSKGTIAVVSADGSELYSGRFSNLENGMTLPNGHKVKSIGITKDNFKDCCKNKLACEKYIASYFSENEDTRAATRTAGQQSADSSGRK